MQETRNSSFGSKNVTWSFIIRKQVRMSDVIFFIARCCLIRHSCVPVFSRRRGALLFSIRNNFSQFRASDVVISQSDHKSYFKTQVCVASLLHRQCTILFYFFTCYFISIQINCYAFFVSDSVILQSDHHSWILLFFFVFATFDIKLKK